MSARGMLATFLSREPIQQRALSQLPIANEFRKVKIEIATVGPWTGKTIQSVDPTLWDVKVLSYVEHPALQVTWGDFTEIMVIGIEDLPEEAMADGWRDVILQMAWVEYLEDTTPYKIGDKVLLFNVYNLAYNRGVKVYYLDRLVYDSEVDNWRKGWIVLKEEIAEVV